MSDESDRLRLDVDPSLVFQLGDRLITDEVTALLELVKNAYDADAGWVKIDIHTKAEVNVVDAFFPGRIGRIEILDNGTGMDRADIQRGWLMLGGRVKRRAKAKGERTPLKQRTTLGDKGLGRLGVQRLGRAVELYSRKVRVERSNGKVLELPTDVELHVGIDWDQVAHASAISLADVHQKELRPPRLDRGSRIVVAGLHDPEVWTGDRITELQTKLAQLLFPFSENPEFSIFLNLDGEPLDLPKLSEPLRQAASSSFTICYESGLLTIQSSIGLSTFRGKRGQKEADEYYNCIVQDRGRGFFEFLQTQGTAEKWKICYEPQGPWFLSNAYEQEVSDLGGLLLPPTDSPRGQGWLAFDEPQPAETPDDSSYADPGPFTGEILTFHLGAESLNTMGEEALKGLPGFVKAHSGVRILREGFGIRPYGLGNNDWLELRSGQTEGSSWYGLRPKNTLGYLAISAERNSRLEEQTNREGFVDSPYAANFFRIIRSAVDEINRRIIVLRRAHNDFVEDWKKRRSNVLGAVDAERLIEQMADNVRSTKAVEAKVRSLASKLPPPKRTGTNLRRKPELPDVPPAGEILSDQELALAVVTAEANDILRDMEVKSAEAEQWEQSAQVLHAALERLREQLTDFAGLASVGLATEAMVHELRGSASRTMVHNSDRAHDRNRDFRYL